MDRASLTHDAVALLRCLIETPSTSRNEAAAANILAAELERCGFGVQRHHNNLWTMGPDYDRHRPTLLFNAHIDTVKPVESWTRNPFEATLEQGDVLYGLGSNDCGGGLVALLQAFRFLSTKPQTYNLLYLASAEEEVSGAQGIRSVLPLLPPIDVAIVGEPTAMQPAIAEKGLMVLDITYHGKSGHAARNEGINAIYQALPDLAWMQNHRFPRVSRLLGPTLMNVTMVNAGTQHNVVPDKCHVVVDIRTNELYTNEEMLEYLSSRLSGDVKARSIHLQPSKIDPQHPIIIRCRSMGMVPYGSPTLSDQALMPFPSFKLGPGQSARSHSADEFIKLSEISQAIDTYIRLLDGLDIGHQ